MKINNKIAIILSVIVITVYPCFAASGADSSPVNNTPPPVQQTASVEQAAPAAQNFSNAKNMVFINSGISLLANPVKMENADDKIAGAVFDVGYLRSINLAQDFAIGVDVCFTGLLSKYTYYTGYNVTSIGVFTLLVVRYEFLSRLRGNRLIPYIVLYLGPLWVHQKGAVPNSKEIITMSYGLGSGFNYWFNSKIALSFDLKILMGNFGALPGLSVSSRQITMWILPTIGISIAI